MHGTSLVAYNSGEGPLVTTRGIGAVAKKDGTLSSPSESLTDQTLKFRNGPTVLGGNAAA